MKAMNVVLTVLCVLFGLMFINAGLNKFLMYMPNPELGAEAADVYMGLDRSGWFFKLVGLVEIFGGLLIAIPKTRALGAIVILPVMVGILFFHLFNSPEGLIVAIILMVVNLWAILANKDKYMHLIR